MQGSRLFLNRLAAPVRKRCEARYTPVWFPWGPTPMGTTPGNNRIRTVDTHLMLPVDYCATHCHSIT